MGHLRDHDTHSHDYHHDGHGEWGSWWGRLLHEMASAFGRHPHDTADQVDEALEADAAGGRRALIVSLVGLAVTALLQAVVVVVSGSVALLGDTLHNVADALTAVPLFVAFMLAGRPPTKRYTYGYGRAEDLAGLFVVAMIASSSVLVCVQAIRRLINPAEVRHLWAVAIAALIGFAGNEIVAAYRIRVGRSMGSAALVADGLHARADGFTSLAVLAGVVGVAVGWGWADPVAGLLITVAILAVLRSAVSQVGSRLMDAVDPALVDQATEAIKTVDGVQAVRELRIRWIGHTLRAEADVTVDDDLSVGQAHDLAHHAEAHLLHYVRRLSAATIHVSPSNAHPPSASRSVESDQARRASVHRAPHAGGTEQHHLDDGQPEQPIDKETEDGRDHPGDHQAGIRREQQAARPLSARPQGRKAAFREAARRP
jgi:cation diffusion facilitator family transporter